jgi:hypothetical protein
MDARAEQVDFLVEVVCYFPLFLEAWGYLVEGDEVVVIPRRLLCEEAEVEGRGLVGG